MTKEELKTLIAAIEAGEFLSACVDTVYITEDMDEDEIKGVIETYIDEHETTYYNVAIEFLSEQDSSLRLSLELADDMGYQAGALNSEILATLLFQDLAREELGELM